MSVLLPIYMVAGSYRFPALRAGGSRVDPWLLGPTIVDMSDVQSKTAAITRRECVVREREADGTLAVTKVDTLDNLADLFTKALARDPFTKLKKQIMNILAHGVVAPVPRARRIAASRAA